MKMLALKNLFEKSMKFILLYGCFALLFCTSTKNSQDIAVLKKQARAQQLTLASVDSMTVTRENGAVSVLLHGMLPNPAYALERVDVDVQNNVVNLLPWMSHDPNKIVIQMTVPFEHNVDIGTLDLPDYTIRVHTQQGILARDLKDALHQSRNN